MIRLILAAFRKGDLWGFTIDKSCSGVNKMNYIVVVEKQRLWSCALICETELCVPKIVEYCVCIQKCRKRNAECNREEKVTTLICVICDSG
jgi:hypothetical protein